MNITNVESLKILSAIQVLIEERKAHQAQVDVKNAQIAELSLQVPAEDADTLEALAASAAPSINPVETSEFPTP